jgi:hypothetical protein
MATPGRRSPRVVFEMDDVALGQLVGQLREAVLEPIDAVRQALFAAVDLSSEAADADQEQPGQREHRAPVHVIHRCRSYGRALARGMSADGEQPRIDPEGNGTHGDVRHGDALHLDEGALVVLEYHGLAEA